MCLILNEVLNNALQHGAGGYDVDIATDAGEGRIVVKNSLPPEKLDLTARSGFKLIQKLSNSDSMLSVRSEIGNESYSVHCHFALDGKVASSLNSNSPST